jgi:uncharacterized protein DUF6880
VAAKTALNTKNLEALGAERLAELLIEISAGNAAAKRRLRVELAGAQSPAQLVKEVRKRIIDRCPPEAGRAISPMRQVAALKPGFTEERQPTAVRKMRM